MPDINGLAHSVDNQRLRLRRGKYRWRPGSGDPGDDAPVDVAQAASGRPPAMFVPSSLMCTDADAATGVRPARINNEDDVTP